jgi:hypothetical protein
MRFKTVKEYRNQFWGKEPSPAERRNLMATMIRKARDAYLKKIATENVDSAAYPNQLLLEANGIEMCEQAFVNMLGLGTSQGYRSSTWINEVDIFNGIFSFTQL